MKELLTKDRSEANSRPKDGLAHPIRHRWLFRFCMYGAFMASATVQGKELDSAPTSQPTVDQAQSDALAAKEPTEFKKMNLDELMNIEVTSVSR